MSDNERKVFPIETVLALASGKKDEGVLELAGYITGRSIVCPTLAAAVAPFAAAWLAKLYPGFGEVACNADKDWDAQVAGASSVLGARVSLPPMAGAMQAACLEVIDDSQAKRAEIAALRKEVAALSAQVEALKPLEAKLAAAEKKRDTAENNLKAMKKDLGGLRRQVAGFEGKVALDQEELLELIKTAIKDNLKSITIAAPAAAGAAAAAAAAPAAGGAAPAAAAPAAGGADEFGFNDGGSGDEFGFGGFGGGDGFGFGDAPAAPAPAAEPEAPKEEFGFGDANKKDEFGFGF